jgi:hypothetical protein
MITSKRRTITVRIENNFLNVINRNIIEIFLSQTKETNFQLGKINQELIIFSKMEVVTLIMDKKILSK